MRSNNQSKTNNSANLTIRKSLLNDTYSLSNSKRPQSHIEISESFVKKRKIILLGAPGVGKSAIILRFKDDIFKNEYMPTIQETYRKEFKFNNEKVELEIIDLDGQNEFSLFTSNKFSLGVNGFIFCYSVENQYSYNLIKVINAKLRSLVGDHIPKILVANKSDLGHKRLISSEQGRELAKELDATFLECSAKNGQNIQLIFHSILVEINKFETNIDLKTYTCGWLLRLTLRHMNRIILLNYILSIIAFVTFSIGLYLGIKINSNNKDSALTSYSLFLSSTWVIVFLFIGFIGVAKKRKDLTNYYFIGLCLEITFYICSCVFYGIFKDIHLYPEDINIIAYLILPFEGLLISLLLLISYCLQKIFIDELENFYIGGMD